MQNQTRNLVIVALIAVLVAVTCWKQSPAQVAPAKEAPMEYLVTGADEKTINIYAEKQRWEVCGTFSKSLDGRNIEAYVILRRPKAAKAP